MKGVLGCRGNQRLPIPNLLHPETYKPLQMGSCITSYKFKEHQSRISSKAEGVAQCWNILYVYEEALSVSPSNLAPHTVDRTGIAFSRSFSKLALEK